MNELDDDLRQEYDLHELKPVPSEKRRQHLQARCKSCFDEIGLLAKTNIPSSAELGMFFYRQILVYWYGGKGDEINQNKNEGCSCQINSINLPG